MCHLGAEDSTGLLPQHASGIRHGIKEFLCGVEPGVAGLAVLVGTRHAIRFAEAVSVDVSAPQPVPVQATDLQDHEGQTDGVVSDGFCLAA